MKKNMKKIVTFFAPVLVFCFCLPSFGKIIAPDFSDFFDWGVSEIDGILSKDESVFDPDFGFFTMTFEAGFGVKIPGLISAEIVPQIEMTWYKLPEIPSK